MYNRKNPVSAIAIITAFCLTGDSMLYVLLPFYWREAGLHSLLEAGMLLAANRLVRLPLGPLVGKLLQRISIRQALMLAIALACTTTVAYGFASGFWIWLLLRCLWGFAWSLLRLGALYAISDVSKAADHGKNMGIYNGIYRMGSLTGMLAGGLLAQSSGMTVASLAFGIVALCSYFWLPLIPHAPSRPHQAISPCRSAQHPSAKRGMERLSLLSPPLLLTLGSGTVIAMLYQGIFTSTLSHIVDMRFHSGLSLGTLTVGAVSLSGFLSAIRWGWEPFLAPLVGKQADLYHGRYLLGRAMLCAVPLFALVPAALPSFIWLGLLIAIQLSATALTTLCDATASRSSAGMPNGKAFLTLYSVLQDTGAALGPLLGYLLTADWLYPACAFLLFLLFVCWQRASGLSTEKHLKSKER